MGIRYYAIYLPNQRSRRKRQPLEVYALVNGTYQLLEGSPVRLPEIRLGLGRERGSYLERDREWLYWYDEVGNRLPTPEERVQQAQADQAQARAERLAEKLRELGIAPNSV